MALEGDLSFVVRRIEEVQWARQEIKKFASRLPFRAEDLVRIELAVSELASNMVRHGGGGKLHVSRFQRNGRGVLRIVATDQGPGIPSLSEALRAGFSTAGSFGDGLPAVRELMDQFVITTEVGGGTCVEVEKWAD